MKAIQVVKYGDASTAFKISEVEKPKPRADQILIKTEVFGLNFADVMARLGQYDAAPPLPAVIGYDVVGVVVEVGSEVQNIKVGDRTTAITRFGGYAEYAVTNSKACAKISNNMDAGEACALTTQYCTAHFAAEEMLRLHSGDLVLIHAAAGGVGTALVQIAKHHGCEIFGTCGSDDKVKYLRSIGVQYPINYQTQDFVSVIRELTKKEKPLDVVFDAIGGANFRKGLSLLNAGGRIVAYGASSMTDAKNKLTQLWVGLQFGFFHPVKFLMPSQSLIGVNMLAVGDQNPKMLERVLSEVSERFEKGIYKPVVAARFKATDISKAHEFLQSRKSIGKIVVSF